MKKKLIYVTFLILSFFTYGDTWEDPETGITWCYTISDNKATIQNGFFSDIPTSTQGAVTIPSILGDCSVTSIGKRAFAGCSGLTSVTIPEGVTSIGERLHHIRHYNLCILYVSVAIMHTIA